VLVSGVAPRADGITEFTGRFWETYANVARHLSELFPVLRRHIRPWNGRSSVLPRRTSEVVHGSACTTWPEAVEISCLGDEGTPKGRRIGRSCSMSMKGTINIRYKKAVEPATGDRT
jgi:hypothetical protein